MEQSTLWKAAAAQRLRRRRLLATAAAGTGSVLLAAACGRSTGPAAGSKATATSGQPRTGGQITVRVPVDPFDWDLSRTGKTTPNSYGTALAYNSLLGFKSGGNVKYNDVIVQPELAESWESPDLTTYTFHLRKGVKFANVAPVSGRELTAADATWSYQYAARAGQFGGKKFPTGQYEWLFEGLDRVESPDASTVVVRFKEPNAAFLTYAASRYNPIVPHEIFDADGSLQKQVIGTGPFQLDPSASQKGTRWVWKKNPTYWDTGKPYLDQVNWFVIADDSAMTAAFATKQIDVLDRLVYDPTAADAIKKTNPAATVDQYVDALCDQLHINVRKPPLSDLRIRQAISLAMDRNELMQSQTGGKGALGMAGVFYDTFTQDEIKQLLKFDPAQAKQLVSAAGFPGGLDLEMTYPGNAYGDTYIKGIQLLQAQLRQAGINLVFKSIDKDDFSSRRKKGDFVINYLNSQPAGEDMGSLAWAIFLPNEQSNYGGVDDPPLTEILKAQQREPDQAKRKDLLRQAAKRINAEQFWSYGPLHKAHWDFWTPALQNYATSFANIGWPLSGSWVSR
jgi:peptide/nickel transport system substrate-binding protein